jgi:branched-chain amino acid aminotransferase
MTELLNISFEPVAQSRIHEVDFDNLVFGRSFADHMFVADYKDGEWTDTRIIPYAPMAMSPANMALHYGQSIFEGLKAFKNEAGEVLVFRPEQNARRINKSAIRMCMPEIPEEIFMEGLAELLKIDSAWVPTKAGCSLYIRPFMFATDEYVGVSPSQTYRFIIFNCPVGAYYAKPLKVWVETQYIRSAEGGVGFAKNAGNYGGSLYPAKLAQQRGYDQLIWTDSKEHKYVEEAGTMNFMFVINNTLVTSATSDTILDGITRKSIITLANEWGVKVEERKVSIVELIEAIKDGSLTEAFGAGTAAVVSEISVIGHDNIDYQLPALNSDSLCRKIARAMNEIKLGQVEDTRNWVFKV